MRNKFFIIAERNYYSQITGSFCEFAKNWQKKALIVTKT